MKKNINPTKIEQFEHMREPLGLQDAIREANRCLLCYDAPCSVGCPAGTDPAKFIRQNDIVKLFRINFEVPVLLTGKLLQKKRIKDKSSIVFISSVATISPYFGGALYGSSKAALESYSKSLALEMAGKGIRSNVISPGLVNTPILTDPAKEGNPEIVGDSINKYLKKYPMGIGEPEDVANVVAFLLSDEARWVSGANILLGGVIQ